MDRFASGQETTKFEVPLPTDVKMKMEEFSSIQKGQIQEVNELKQSVNEQIANLVNDSNHRFIDMNSRVERLERWNQANADELVYHNYHLGNLIRFMVSNALIRFLNFHFFRWFTITIAENRFPLNGKHDKYYAYIAFVNPDEDLWPDEYGTVEYKKHRKADFQEKYKIMKTHLKKIKADGYDLSNIRFRF